MPIPLIPAIISSIIEGAVDQPPARPAPPPGVPAGIVRTLPAQSLAGIMNSIAPGNVQIDGKTLPLSPAAQIRDQANMIVLSTTLQGNQPVRYTMDQLGYVARIWILTPAELATSR
jgi:hypothetical protein